MTGYVVAGYGLVVVGVAGYAWQVLRRGRRLAASLPPEERTWR